MYWKWNYVIHYIYVLKRSTKRGYKNFYRKWVKIYSIQLIPTSFQFCMIFFCENKIMLLSIEIKMNINSLMYALWTNLNSHINTKYSWILFLKRCAIQFSISYSISGNSILLKKILVENNYLHKQSSNIFLVQVNVPLSKWSCRKSVPQFKLNAKLTKSP